MRNLNTKTMCQFFILLLSLLNSTLAQAKFDLPPLKTDAEKLSFLLQVRQQIPKLFADAATYDIDLFNLLDNEAELVALLQKNHINFDQLYDAKKYVKMTVMPTADIWLGQVEIDPKAIEDWKNSLHQKIKDAKDSVKFEDIAGDTQKMLDLDPVTLLNTFGIVDKKDKKLRNQFKKQNAVLLACKQRVNLNGKGVDLYEKYKCIYDSYEALSGLPKLASKEEIERIMKALLEEERILPLLHLAIIKDYKHPQNWENFTNIVDKLNSQDLLFLSDIDGLKPLLLASFNHDDLDPRFILTLKRIHKELEGLSKRTISRATKINNGIELIEVPPTVGIFRGCVGGDCSSQMSFPYPNDPHERVFLIKKLKPGLKEDDNDRLKGYLSATEVIVNGEPALYVVTISGVNISAADTELIFRGLDEAKEKLGVKLIVLPASDKLKDLINFPAILGVYEKHLNKNSPRITIEYQDQDIRKEIQNYQPSSKSNEASYDHMTNNMNGAVLSFNSDKNVSIAITPIKRAQNDSSLLDPQNIFDFIYELNKSKRKDTIQRILQIDEVRKILGDGSAEKIENFFKLISADSMPQTQKKMKISEFRNYVIATLKKLNFNLNDSYIEKFSKLMHGGYLFCEDIFSENNIEKTAGFLASSAGIDEDFYAAMPREQRVKIFNTKKFAKYKPLFYEVLDSVDFDDFSKGVKFFEYAETIDEQTFQKLISIITNSKLDLNFRKTAIEAFYMIPPNDYGMLMNSLVICLRECSRITYAAAEFLLKIGQQDRIFTEVFINFLNDGPKLGLKEFLRVLRTLALNNSHVANEIANNPMVIGVFTNCLNDVPEQELIEIIGMIRVIAVNNTVIMNSFVGHLKRAQKMNKYSEICEIIEAIVGNNIHGANEIASNPMLIEVFINCLNDAQGQELIEILRVLRKLVANNPLLANEIANNHMFIKAFINRLHNALGLELIELIKILASSNRQANNEIVNNTIEVLINRLENAHGHELEIISALEILAAANAPYVNDQIVNNPIVIEAIIKYLNDVSTNKRIKLIEKFRIIPQNNSIIIECLIKCLNEQDAKTRFAVIHQLKKIIAKYPNGIDQVMSYFKRHVHNNVRETAKLLFGDNYRKFFARSADCNLL